jgi:hypothetical protein
MGFKLWVHDIQGHDSKLSNNEFETPPNDKIVEYRLQYKPTVNPGLRIHLHAKEGMGRIIVSKVTVKKL